MARMGRHALREAGVSEIETGRRRSTPFHPVVFPVSVGLIVAFALYGVLAPTSAASVFGRLNGEITGSFGWLYIMSMSVFLVFVLFAGIGPWGKVRLGKDTDRPEFGVLTWLAMLFSAGMGIGLLFFSVAEPVLHYVTPPVGRGRDLDAARAAMGITFFHWGLHPWACYALVGMGLAYFGYRKGLPLSIRSLFVPLLGDRVHGRIGDLIDIIAVVATLFGVATSLGLGAQQINAGLSHLFGLPSGGGVQVVLIGVVTAIATVSVVTGLHVGVRRLSEVNIVLAVGLLLFVAIAGPTLFVLNGFVENIGTYFQQLPVNSFWTATWDAPDREEWLGSWTVFYWAWWISWSPFVGMFIARISRGRTIREFVFGVMIVAPLTTFVWLSVFGNTALHSQLYNPETGVLTPPARDAPIREGSLADLLHETRLAEPGEIAQGNDPAGAAAAQASAMVHEVNWGNVPVALFVMLDGLPLALLTGLAAVLCITLFFVTSSDSASLVIDTIASGGKPHPSPWMRVFWAVAEGVVAAVLLLAGGLVALQSGAIATALPFCVVLLLGTLGLAMALRSDPAVARAPSGDGSGA